MNVTGVLGYSLVRESRPFKEIVDEFVESLLGHFNVYIRFPDTDDEVTELTDKFIDRSRIPQVVGAVDRTRIEIKAPKENPDDYYNRKGYRSVLLQGVADSK